MAIPINFYERQQPNVLGAVTLGLQQRLAREQMMIQDRRAQQNAQLEERNRQRQHEAQMAQFGLSEMKFNYEMEQNQPGGLNYISAMSNVQRDAAAIAAQEEQRKLAEERRNNPQKFWRPTAASQPKVIPLTAGQIKANQDAVAMGMPPPHAVTVIQPSAGAYSPAAAPSPGYSPSSGPGYTDPGYDLPSSTTGPGADPLIMEPIPAGTYDPAAAGGGADLLAPPMAPADNSPQAGAAPPVFTAAPGVAPVMVAQPGQGTLPMDPMSMARRQAMENTRVKAENTMMTGLATRRQKAVEALDADPKDPLAALELQAVEREMRKIITPAPRAETVSDEAPGRIDESQNVAGRGPLTMNSTTGQFEYSTPAAAEPERAGIGLLPKSATNAEANRFWNEGKAEAFRVAKLDQATDEELATLAKGGSVNSVIEYITGPAYNPAVGLEEKVKSSFRMPAGADSDKAKGRSGEVAISEFIQAAARDELNRRKVVQPKKEGVRVIKTKSPAAPNG